MRKLAIVGTHPRTRGNAPYDDPEWDIWAFNESASQMVGRTEDIWMPRCDAIFQMHEPTIYRSPHNRADRKHWEWLQQEHGDLVIYMQEVDPDVPNSEAYPLDSIKALVKNFRQGDKLINRVFLTSSVAQSIALAVLHEYDYIRVYGVEMSSNTEFSYQRDCVAAWVWFALGRGIKVDFYGGDTIWDRPVYGYEGSIEADPEEFGQRAAEIRESIIEARKKAEKAKAALSIAYENGNLSDRIGELAVANKELGHAEGAFSEVVRYGEKILPMVEESGKAIIDRNEYEGAAAQAADDAEKFGQMVYRTAGHIDTMMQAWQESRNAVILTNLKKAIDNHCIASYNSGKAQGIYDENFRLATDIDEHIRAAGGDAAIAAMNPAKQGRKCELCGRVG